MNAGRWFGRVAAWAADHARTVLAACVLLAIVAGFGATRLATATGPEALVDDDSGTFQATQGVRETFGEEPVIVLAKGDLQELLLSANVFRLLRLEGCLSGNVPKGAKPIPGPCTELARLDPVEFVSGPTTFLNGAVVQIDRQLRRLARRVPPERFREFLLAVATRYGITTLPSLDNPDFVATVVFDLRRARGTPKARLSYVFPDSRSAQIAVRLRPGLGEEERERATELIDAAVHDTTPRRACAERGDTPAPCFRLEGGSYVVSGGPAAADGVSEDLRSALLVLFGVAVIVMAATLLLVFQARYDEEAGGGASAAEAAVRAAAKEGPALAAACLAAAAGFLALGLSPVPLVQEIGLLLALGVGLAVLLALVAGMGALALPRVSSGRGSLPRHPPGERLLSLAMARPVEVLGVGLAIAVLGWGVGTRVDTTSGIDVPGQLEVSVRAPDLEDPATVEWIADFEGRVLRVNGLSGESRSCLGAENCPGTQVIGNQALLSFEIRAQSAQDREALVERVRGEIGEPGSPDAPPAGAEVELAGLSALAAESADDLSTSRYWLALVALAAVALVLLAVYRSARRAVVPLVPAVLATGWASLVLWLSGIPLNPLSGALGALTIAIATQFAVLLAARFHQERHGGRDAAGALRRAYERTGAAVLASGIAAVAGFAMLIVSDMPMLRGLGMVAAFDLSLALLGVMLVLPAALPWSEQR